MDLKYWELLTGEAIEEEEEEIAGEVEAQVGEQCGAARSDPFEKLDRCGQHFGGGLFRGAHVGILEGRGARGEG